MLKKSSLTNLSSLHIMCLNEGTLRGVQKKKRKFICTPHLPQGQAYLFLMILLMIQVYLLLCSCSHQKDFSHARLCKASASGRWVFQSYVPNTSTIDDKCSFYFKSIQKIYHTLKCISLLPYRFRQNMVKKS